jgi:hypothetical protein
MTCALHDRSCWRDNNLLNLLNIRPTQKGVQNAVPSGSSGS